MGYALLGLLILGLTSSFAGGYSFVFAIILPLLLRTGRSEMKKQEAQDRAKAEADEQEQCTVFEREVEKALPVLQAVFDKGEQPIDPTTVSYRPVRGERLLAVQDHVAWIEEKRTGRFEGYVNSARVNHGPFSSRYVQGHVVWETALRETAQGRLLVTDRAIVFEGVPKSARITWGQVAHVVACPNGVGIIRRNGPNRRFFLPEMQGSVGAALKVCAEAT